MTGISFKEKICLASVAGQMIATALAQKDYDITTPIPWIVTGLAAIGGLAGNKLISQTDRAESTAIPSLEQLFHNKHLEELVGLAFTKCLEGTSKLDDLSKKDREALRKAATYASEHWKILSEAEIRPELDALSAKNLATIIQGYVQHTEEAQPLSVEFCRSFIGSCGPLSKLPQISEAGMKVAASYLSQQLAHALWELLKHNGAAQGLAKQAYDQLFQAKVLTRFDSIEELLAKILGIVQPPRTFATPPQICQLPPSLADAFVGRETVMEKLCGLLREAGRAITETLHGFGGVGKSRLAIEAGHLMHNEGTCPYVFWIAAAGLPQMKTQLAALVARDGLNLPEQENSDPAIQWQAVRNWLLAEKNKSRWLLIVDNADTADQQMGVRFLREKELSQGRIIVTTRLRGWGSGYAPREIGLLNSQAAVYLLQRLLVKGGREAFGKDVVTLSTMVERLGYLPLALELAAHQMTQEVCNPVRYLALWEKDRIAVLEFTDPTAGIISAGRDTLDADRERAISLVTTWKRSTDTLSPHAAALLHVIGWFAPVFFSRAVFDEASGKLREALSSVKESCPRMDSLVAELHGRCLIDVSDASLSLHPLLSEVMRHRMENHTRTVSLRQALTLINDVLPNSAWSSNGWGVWEHLVPHLEAMLSSAQKEGLEELIPNMCNTYGAWRTNRAEWAEAEPLLRRALEIWEKIHGLDHPQVAIGLNNLATLLRATNRMVEAETLFNRALGIWETTYGPDHPQVAIALNNLGGLLEETNQLTRAEPVYRRGLKIREKVCGPDDPQLATGLNNLGNLLWQTNQMAEAELLLKRALEIWEKIHGLDHPQVAIASNNLGGLLRDTNRMAEAEPLLRRTLEILEKAYGPDYPQVAIALNSLGNLLWHTNRIPEAEQLCRRSLRIMEKVYDPEHPQVATGLSNLATLLRSTNRTEEAERLLQRANNSP